MAFAAERPTVAVLWMGGAESFDTGERLVGDVNSSLDHAAAVRPLDSREERRLLVRGGELGKLDEALRDGEAAFGKLQFAVAVTAFETAQRILLEEVPLSAMPSRWSRTERGLLACYDQLGRGEDAARAAERLTWLGGGPDVAALIAKHRIDRSFDPERAPVQVSSDPPGAQVWRNLQPVGVTPFVVRGGDPSLDVLDLQAPGRRRVHLPLPVGGDVAVPLPVEDRVGVLVDEVRLAAPDAPVALVAALGRRLGAARLLALMPTGSSTVRARWFDVAKGDWAMDPIDTDVTGQPAVDRLVAYVAGGEVPPPPAVAGAGAPVVVAVQAAGPPPKKQRGPWAKWYTWVAAGAVVAGVVTLVLVDRVGSDKLTVTASH